MPPQKKPKEKGIIKELVIHHFLFSERKVIRYFKQEIILKGILKQIRR